MRSPPHHDGAGRRLAPPLSRVRPGVVALCHCVLVPADSRSRPRASARSPTTIQQGTLRVFSTKRKGSPSALGCEHVVHAGDSITLCVARARAVTPMARHRASSPKCGGRFKNLHVGIRRRLRLQAAAGGAAFSTTAPATSMRSKSRWITRRIDRSQCDLRRRAVGRST